MSKKKILVIVAWIPFFLAGLGIFLDGSEKFVHLASKATASVKAKTKAKHHSDYSNSSDLSIVGNLLFADGIGRQSILLMDALQNDLSINFISVSKNNFLDVPKYLLKRVNQTRSDPGKVVFYEMPLENKTILNKFLPHSHIKIAYSMLESTRIPQEWVKTLNRKFDAVVVPDEFLVSAYKKSGVNIPIFTIPLGIYLNEFLEKPIKKEKNDVFTFGNLSAISERKNIDKLIKGFSIAFGNRNDVKLVLNSRFCNRCFDPMPVLKTIEELGLKNVEVSWKSLEWSEYVEKMASFDCYVNVAKGEGFSVQPREALALGLPTILTNNTAQKTICDSGYVREVSSEIAIPASIYGIKGDCGQMFDCTVEDIADALRDVYENYNEHLLKAKQGKEWVKQYHFKNLKPKFLTLSKPKRVELGDEDRVEDNYLVTSSEKLYEKYLFLMSMN